MLNPTNTNSPCNIFLGPNQPHMGALQQGVKGYTTTYMCTSSGFFNFIPFCFQLIDGWLFNYFFYVFGIQYPIIYFSQLIQLKWDKKDQGYRDSSQLFPSHVQYESIGGREGGRERHGIPFPLLSFIFAFYLLLKGTGGCATMQVLPVLEAIGVFCNQTLMLGVWMIHINLLSDEHHCQFQGLYPHIQIRQACMYWLLDQLFEQLQIKTCMQRGIELHACLQNC